MLAMELRDLVFKGHLHTWWNKSEESPLTKKLDRVLVNDEWLLQFPLSFSLFGEPDFSDHSPICVSLGTNSVRTKSSFMFTNYITRHPSFLPLMAHHWSELYVRGTEMFSFAKRLGALKKPIRELCKDQVLRAGEKSS